MPNCKKADSITFDPKEYYESKINIYEASNVFFDFHEERLLHIY